MMMVLYMVKSVQEVVDDALREGLVVFLSVWMGGIGGNNDGEVWKGCGGVNYAVQNKEGAESEICSV